MKDIKLFKSWWKRIFVALFACVAICILGQIVYSIILSKYRAQVTQTMQRMNLAFEQYASASTGNYYPMRTAEPGIFLPDMEEWAKIGDGKAEFEEAIEFFKSDKERPLCYLGYAFYNDELAEHLLDLMEDDPQAFRGGGTSLEEEKRIDEESPAFDGPHPLREGVGNRFVWAWYWSVARPPDEWTTAGPIPILWQIPKRIGDKVPVLFMNGRVEFIEYPGSFPMSSLFINRLRDYMGLPQDPGFSMDTPIIPIVRRLLKVGSRDPLSTEVGSLLRYDVEPSVSLLTASGYRLEFQSAEFVLFPDENNLSDIAANTLFDSPDEELYSHYRWQPWRIPRYMGTANGMHWYGNTYYEVYSLLDYIFN